MPDSLPLVELPSLPADRFDNRYLLDLPGDPSDSPWPRQVHGAAWSRVQPTPTRQPQLLMYAPEVADLLGIAATDIASPHFAAVFGGSALVAGMQPWAAAYGGHQFGNWAGQLGDGRAMSLGEVLDTQGQRQELQLKGAGRTPYSRSGDGRAVLRSSLREFLCSEAMFHLGVPTTRALSLVGTGDAVVRDILYDGHPRPEPGAVVCRVAPSFVRFGHFELPASRGDVALLQRLLDFVIARDYPQLTGNLAEKRAAFFAEVCTRTARLMAAWLRVGFVHGVMNTDNLSVLGLTIDYGPYGWLEEFDPGWTPNTTDAANHRYAYGRQPSVAQWNLQRLADALTPLVAHAELVAGLQAYVATFVDCYHRDLAAKMGLSQWRDDDADLWEALQAILIDGALDHTRFFRQLSEHAGDDPQPFAPLTYDPMQWGGIAPRLQAWLQRWQDRVTQEGVAAEVRKSSMRKVNPRYVPRNWLAQEAIDAAEQGDLAPLQTLLDVLRRPYDDQPGRDHYAAMRPAWANHRPGCSMLSCSS